MPSDEFFYLDKDGKKADAELHEAILDQGDYAKAQEPTRTLLRAQGFTNDQINAFLAAR
jgi:hypothetical protein